MSHDNFAAVRERIDPVALIEDLAQAHVAHSSASDVRLTPCPFCSSKTGFSVNPQTKTYYCHHAGCGTQGDVFTFVMQLKGFTRKYDALKFLADRVGYELPKAGPLADDRLDAILRLAGEVKRVAAEYYAAQLWARRDEEFTYRSDGAEHTATVLGYQTGTRAHSEDVLRKMGIGWADGGLLAHLKATYRDHSDRKLAFAAFIASGLVRRGKTGFHDFFRPGGYLYPITDNGRVVTMTAKYPDEGIASYQLPRTVELNGREVPVWNAPFYFLNQESLGADDLVVVEGENDLLSVMDLAQHAAVAGLRGTPKKDQLAALAERRSGKRTFLCVDTDDAGIEILWTVAESLAGPENDARVIAWEPGEGRKDIDDVLRAAGRESAAALFATMRSHATPVLEWLAGYLERDMPEDKKCAAAERFALVLRGLPALSQERWEKRMRKALGASARTVRKLVADASKPKPPEGPPRSSTGPRVPASPAGFRHLFYRWGPAGLERVENQEIDGQTVEKVVPVANFIIRIDREAEVIDDIDEARELECTLLLSEPPPGIRPEVRLKIDSSDFGSPNRLAAKLIAAGNWHLNFSFGDTDFIRNASTAFSRDKGVTNVRKVRYIGYADVGGGGASYVSPSVVVRDGRVLSADEVYESEGVCCELPRISSKAVKRLDLAVISDEAFRETLRHIFDDLVPVKDIQVGRACLGHTALAPVLGRLSGFRPYVLAIIGATGFGKTTCTTYFQNFFGPGFTNDDLAGWGSTAKMLETVGHYFKDALYLVDDFKRNQFPNVGALKDAMRVLQNYADGSGRDRLTRASKMMASAHIRGMLMMTGEDLPEGESSNLARIVPLALQKRKLTPDDVTRRRRCEKHRRLYAGVMSRYIAWTQAKGDAFLQERADELFDSFLADSDIMPVEADNKPRILQNLTLNLLGLVLFAEFAGESGALTEDEAQRTAQEHYAFLKGVFLSHVETVSEERPIELFLRDVSAMIDSEIVRLARVRALSRGYETVAGGGLSTKPLIGYEDSTHVYLLSDALFKELGEYRARGHLQAGEFSKRAITDQLLDDGILVPNASKSGTNSVKKHRITVDHGQKYVHKIARSVFGRSDEGGESRGYSG